MNHISQNNSRRDFLKKGLIGTGMVAGGGRIIA
ncbi:MAG TPA: twin-arginine translocation signal domain-containing protein [Bacteroidales bacterium]|mgnify:CR=1 FL=1|nr:twin-arginine translocation signal domain-containing protein [Bacteroidales bacterium]